MGGMNTSAPLRIAALIAALAAAGFGTPVSASAPADASCVLLLPENGGMLINQCGKCREVTLERVRAGESIPNIRSIIVPGEAIAPMPFRGPGRTRIIGERACPLPPGRITQQATISR